MTLRTRAFRLAVLPKSAVGMFMNPSANCVMAPSWQGQPPAVPSLVDIESRLSADEVRAIVTRGRGQMPAISPLSDAALDFLVAYVLHPKRAPATGPRTYAKLRS